MRIIEAYLPHRFTYLSPLILEIQSRLINISRLFIHGPAPDSRREL